MEQLEAKDLIPKLYFTDEFLDQAKAQTVFNEWYKAHVESLLSEAKPLFWKHDEEDAFCKVGFQQHKNDTHTGLVIASKPLRQEKPSEILDRAAHLPSDRGYFLNYTQFAKLKDRLMELEK